MRLLIDAALARSQPLLLEALERAGHQLTRAKPEPSSLDTLASFDVIITPSVELSERLYRDAPTLAVIVFTRPGDALARVRALDGGAADAMDASFPMSQMVARVGAAGRRAALMPRPPSLLEVDGCTIDLGACTVSRGTTTHALTRRELELIRYFARHPGRTISRAELLQHVWNVSPRNDTRAVDVAISSLRSKLERTPSSPTILLSIKGTGYRWL